MKIDKFGQLIFAEQDIIDLCMRNIEIASIEDQMLIDDTVDLSAVSSVLDHIPKFQKYNQSNQQLSVRDFDTNCQNNWYMPQRYKDLDIAEHVLSLCDSDAELQRCGQELMLYQERNLFDLLRYLAYLVDTMREHGMIWGVGRGSSVASYVLYKLGVHCIDSMYYDLDPQEFLR